MSGRTPELRVLVTKRADGGAVLRCVRRDGSETWQKHEGAKARFFPFHDLTHLAVETELGFRRGFYGLLADGWDIAETEGKSERGRPPEEAILVEHVVGLLERERVGGALPLAADRFHAEIVAMAGGNDVTAGRAFSEDELSRVRERIETLHGAWAALPAGATMELEFERNPKEVGSWPT